MKKRIVVVAGILLAMTAAWAFAQAGGGGGRGGFGQNREAQQKAIAALQEQVAQLKAMTERTGQGAQGRNFQDMSDEERTKMREEMTKRREEQAKIMASMQQSLDTLKGGRQLFTEHQEAMAPLNDLLASAQQENAKATAKKIEQLIAQRQKQFEDKITAMGMTMEQVQRMGQRRQQQ
ncbi:MAG: hypothetical protein A2Y77_10980 [Planctomycetes bacterium RBG_13_62_9]|nr:MAG: hypothetical protein A2Y77_10980 [Planctomycetes bacterium RBG_13_62_9]